VTVTPRIARVKILYSTIEGLEPRVYRSLDDAEAAIAKAMRNPGRSRLPNRDHAAFLVVWTDGHSHEDAVQLRTGVAPYAVIRTRLRQVALWSRDVYGASKSLTEAERADRRAWGNDMLARLDAEPSSSTRNLNGIPEDQLLPLGTTSSHLDDITLLPDPIAAVGELEAHFAAIRPAIPVWMGHGRTVPRTTNEDVTYAANRLSIALAHDMARLRAVTGRPHGAIWDRWARTIEHVRRHLGTDPDAPYRDNQRYWSAQVPQLAHQMAQALHGGEPRNAGDDEWMQYRVTSRRPDGSLVTTFHTARDHFDARKRAAFYLGYGPQIVSMDAQYTDGVWSPATMIDEFRRPIHPSSAAPAL
jgi:hypothetical protein